MYTAHFGLNTAPFSITPDPHYFYSSTNHSEALAHLVYGVNEGPGFVLLTGEVGTGKTTLCRSLIEQLPHNFDVALLLNPCLSPIELLAALFDELRISYSLEQYQQKDFIDKLTSYLLTADRVGHRTVLILDEAQNLSSEALEQIRLLTNLETGNHKLLQIILVGQPELKKLLKRNNLRQLSQRITARYHLLPLSRKDTKAYINHRLAISGVVSRQLFSDSAVKLIYRYSAGVPRLINILCDRALLGGYVSNKDQINTEIIYQAIEEVTGEAVRKFNPQVLIVVCSFLLVLAGVINWGLLKPVTVSSSAPIMPTAMVNKPVSNLEYLLNITNTETAFRTLFNLWGTDYLPLAGEKACESAANKGLACFLKIGTWDDLRSLNRPAIIELVTLNGMQYHIVVKYLLDDIAVLVVAERTYEIPIHEINKLWLGQFLILWQPPMLPMPILKVGMIHQGVIWIRKQLNMESRSALFDYALRTKLIAFQAEHNLKADGVIGEQTLLALQALRGEPLLLE
ncbi:ExeA family protein [Candidatus Marithrix sp. Canyon 246]|uniref:ExeA family protein n=1 Tax=Candidatus Marithrix sp. Canyon 246 TaxID=1827136 RepID=UPI00084A0B82|nr:ExeA family protein [Candidatus Marithrix sp. Canyon 246]